MDVKLRISVDFISTVQEDVKGNSTDDRLRQVEDFVKACLATPQTLFKYYKCLLNHSVHVNCVNACDDGISELENEDCTLYEMIDSLVPEKHGFVIDVINKITEGVMDLDHPNARLVMGPFSTDQATNVRIEMLHPYQMYTDFPIETIDYKKP